MQFYTCTGGSALDSSVSFGLLYGYMSISQQNGETLMAKQINPTGRKTASHGTHRAKRHPNSPKNPKS